MKPTLTTPAQLSTQHAFRWFRLSIGDCRNSLRQCFLLSFVSISVLSAGALINAPAAQARAVFSEADYKACQAQDIAAFQIAIEALTRKALAAGLTTIDYEAIVRDEWRRREIDQVINQRVDMASDDVRKESSWSSLLKSLAFRKRAQELASAVADRVYRSDAVTQAVSELSTGVGERIGKSIELSTIDAAGPAQRCVKAFLGPRYGQAVAGVVEKDAAKAFMVDAESGQAPLGNSSVLLENAGGLTGVVVLLVRRQVARMASRLGQRIVGSVLSRVVSVAAGGVGLALIAKDVWDLRYGMLPIIQAEMKSASTRNNVQAEIAKSIKEQISAHGDQLASATSARIVDIWRDFKRAHTKTLEIAENDAEFRSFVDTLGADNLPRLDEVVSLILAKDGANGVGKALRDGRLHTAVTKLSDKGMLIARDRGSLDDALKWSALADDNLEAVIELGLHQRGKPEAFDRTTLRRLLALDNRAAKLKLAALQRPVRDILFELDDANLVRLGRNLSENELNTLGGYLQGLDRDAGQIVLAAVANKPTKMRALASDHVRDAVTGSRNQSAAVTMLLHDGPALDIKRVSKDVQLAVDGEIQPILIWERHPLVVIGAGISILLLLLILRGLFFSSRPSKRAKRQQSAAAKSAGDAKAAGPAA